MTTSDRCGVLDLCVKKYGDMGLGFLGVMDRAVEKCVTRKFVILAR